MKKFEDLSREEQKDIYINILSGHEKEVEIISILAIITTYRMRGETYLKYFNELVNSEIKERLQIGLTGDHFDAEEIAWSAVMDTLESVTIFDILEEPERYINDYINIEHSIREYANFLYKEFSKERKDIVAFRTALNLRKIAEGLFKDHLPGYESLGHIFDALENIVSEELQKVLDANKAVPEGQVQAQPKTSEELINCLLNDPDLK